MGKWTNYMAEGSQSMNNTDQWLPEEETENIVSAGNFTPDSYVPENAVDTFQPAPVEPEWTPESDTPAPRAWDIYYKPSWFVEEQTNRKNPTYTPDANWTNEQVDAIANYVTGMKNNNPNEWRYGDPGWDTSTQLWQETIKPIEDAYQEEQKKIKAEQQAQFYSYHNNKMNTTSFEGEEGVLSQDQVDSIKANSPYKLHDIDKTSADYESLSRSGKLNFNFMPGTAGTDVKNRKPYQRFSQPVISSLASAGGPATVAKLLAVAVGGPAGLVYGAAWAGTAAYSYAKGANLIKGNDTLDKFIELTDILDKKGAQAQGALAYGFEKAGGGDWTDWSKAGENLDFLINNIDTIMHYAFGEGRASSEYPAEVVDVVGSLVPNMGANVIGINGQGASRQVRNILSAVLDNPEDRIHLERNQTTRANSGLEGVYEIPEELLGTNAYMYWLEYGKYLWDHGVTNPKQLEYELGNAVNEVYGDLSNYSEFIEHEIGDPGNTMEGMQSREIYAYAKLTGDENLANAAYDNIGNLGMDLAGQVPGLQGLIETVGRMFGKEIRSSGGIDEVINTWDMENLQSTDPSKLTARDRRVSGINEDGSLKSLEPLKNPNEIKNPFLRGAEKIKQLFQTTPEWRATMAGDSIMNFISTGIEDALSARPGDNDQARIDRVMKFVDELENPETISENSPFSKPSKTILFNSIKEDLSQAVRTRRQEINKVIQDYAKLEPNRQVLMTLSEALGLSPDKIMQKYQDQKTVLAQMIINKADENGGKIPGIDIDVESREFGDRVISMLAPFAGKDAKAYDPRALMLQITSRISDGVTETLINKYNIQEEGWVYRFGDTVKKLQHLWLLGLSPSYLANNVVNNVLTRAAIGYGGFLTPKAINDWTDRFGFQPGRFTESMAEGILEKDSGKASEKMRAAIRSKRKGKNKFFDKVDSKLDWVSDHAGFFSAISGWVEERESKQIYASAMMTYMARTWKPGVNFRKMDPQLENLINSKAPGMVDAIYSAISAGVNMKEIENAIYGSFIIPSIQDTLVDAARRQGITDAEDAIIELFNKGGIYAELQKALQGKRGNEIDAVINKVIERAQAIANIRLAEDLARRAEQVANDTANYGFAEAIKVGQETADQMADLWIKSHDANTQLFNRRVKENMKTDEFRALYVEHQKALNEQWAGVYATAEQNYLGILNGLGFTDETTKKYTDQMKQKDGLWTKFYQEVQPEAVQPYLDALVWQTDDDFAKWDSRVRKAWSDYTKDINQKYADTVKEEQNLQIQMDKTFADGLKSTLDKRNKAKVDANIVPLQEQIRNKRQEIVNKNRELREIADNTNVLNEKNRVYKEAQAERDQLVNDYRILQKQLYEEIRALGPQTVAPAQNSVTATPDPAADIRADATQRRAEQAQREAEQLAEATVEDVAETGDVTDAIDEEYRKGLEDELQGIYQDVEDLTNQINALIQENNLEKNLDEIKRLSSERAGKNIRAYQIEQELDEMRSSFTPKNFKEVLRKKTAYKIAKEMGADNDLAVAYSQLNKIHDKEWEQNHPGRKYRDVGDITVEYSNEERIANGPGLYQTTEEYLTDPNRIELLIKQTESENFKEWNKDNNIEGKGEAVTAFHGTRANPFEEFDPSKRKTGAGGWDTELGWIYFTNSYKAAKSYNTPLWGLTPEEILQSYLSERPKSYTDFTIPDRYDHDAISAKNWMSRILRFQGKDAFKDSANEYSNDYRSAMERFGEYIDSSMLMNPEQAISEMTELLSDEGLFDNIDNEEIPATEGQRKLATLFGRLLEEDKWVSQFLEGGRYDKSVESSKQGFVEEFFVKMEKPYYLDMQGKGYDMYKYHDAIVQADYQGCDGVVVQNVYDGAGQLATVYILKNPNQTKSIHNGGEFSKQNNFYHQEQQQRIKGQFSIEDGEKIAKLFLGSDISTLIHETMAHGWSTTLNDNQLEALAAYNGWTADKYRQLENQWYYDPASMTAEDRVAWEDAQEKFAYGFEQYLLEGKAPNSAMKEIFETFKRYLLEIYHGVRNLIYKGEKIDIHKEQHGVTLAEIFESMLIDSGREFNIDRNGLTDVERMSITDDGSYGYVIPEGIRQFLMTDSAKRGEKIQTMKTNAEESMRLETQNFLEENKKWGLTEPELQELVTEIMHQLGLNIDLPEDMVLMDAVQQKLSRFPGGEKAIKRFIDTHRETASKISDTAMDAMLNSSKGSEDVFQYVLNQVGNTEENAMKIRQAIEAASDYDKRHGNFEVPVDEFQHGSHTVNTAVYRNRELVAYVPTDMISPTVDLGNGESVQVLGIDPTSPDQWVYQDGDEIITAQKREVKKENPMTGDAETDSLGALDPEPQSNHQLTYDTIVPVLKEFGDLYKNALNDAMASKKFGSLDANTKELVRQYIDNDVRTDLMNTKYKTGKFGEMMRDAALLNYSKRYGFDNALTLLFPYQFWNTRSAWNWINRMGGKGGKMWRRYARLKEMEERNKKELLPSKITGKIGIYLPFLPEWMGDALFMPTSQLSIVGNFMDPLDDWLTDNAAVNATAERLVQEALDNGDITQEEYQMAMDPAKRAGSAVWQEMFAQAQTEGDHDRDLGSLFKQYFGMSLPVSIGKALITGNPDDWTQTPMSRTGTAFRALFGDNIVGKGLEFAMSAPERALRKAAVELTGNNDFRYQELGNFGDYYIRNQVWDMVVEGKISAPQAVEACIEKDGNKIWEQAADRQRIELLQKTQLLSATMPFKKMVEDVKNGNQDKLADDWKYVLAELLTMWTPTSVVRDAERTWRADKAEMNKLYDTGTKDDRSKFYDEHPYYTYNNLRYEADDEQALRSYLYKSIMDRWYDLSDTEKDELKIAFGTDFQRSILSEKTRAYQTMDLDRLAAYAQALNGSIPYLATDSLNTTNVPKINIDVIPMAEQISQETYLKEREKAYPGMADVENIYYDLPAADRATFRKQNPKLVEYWQWKKQYKKEHPEVENYQNRRTDYYNTLNAENVFALLDQFTIKELNRAAWSKDKVRKEYQSTIERAMLNAGVTDGYDDFVKILKDYILGE